MARSLRIDYPETFYHVLSRGNEKRDIFYGDLDYVQFLTILGRMVERFGLEVHAYVLMSNHYHLLVRTKDANLSRAIQWLGVSYSVWFNRRHSRTGHLFQGRFKSFLVQDEHYFTAMCLYIHGNPVRAGVTTRLSGYPWSSFPAYAGNAARPPWLTTRVVLGMYGSSHHRFEQEQRLFLEKRPHPLEDLRHGLYLGAESFAEECLQRADEEQHVEKPQYRSLLRSRDAAAAAVEILGWLGESNPTPLLHRQRIRSVNRDVAIYALYHLGAYRNRDIGRVFGIGYTAVSAVVRRAQKHLESDPALQKTLNSLLSDK